MSTVKISQLPLITQINANTSNTLFAGVDVPTDTTGKMTAHTLAQGLYSNEVLNVGTNPVIFPNTAAQFSGSDPLFLQVNQQNFNANGSADYILTADVGTNVTNYIDLGINNSQFSNVGFTSMYPLDGYLYVQDGGSAGGNLIVGTASANTHMNFIVGGTNQQNVVAKMTVNGLSLQNSANLTFSDGTTQITAGASNAYSQAAFALANTAASNTVTLQSQTSALQSNVLSLQSQALVFNSEITSATGNTVVTQGVDATQNTNITNATNTAQAAFTQANAVFVQSNTNTNTISTIQSINNTQNTNIGLAWNTANTAVQNTANIILPGNVTFNGANTNFNSNIVTYGTMTTTGNVVATGNLIATGPVTFNGNFVNNGLTTNNGNTINNGNLTTTGNVISVGYLTANGQSTFNGNTIHNGYISVANNLAVNNVFIVNVPTQTLSMNGMIYLYNSTVSATNSAVRIDGSNNGIAQQTTSTGTMLQVTGLDGGYATRILVDNYNSGSTSAYPLIAARAARGNSANPTGSLAGDILGRFAGQGYGTTGYTTLAGAQMDFIASENQSDTNKGTNIVFNATAIGSNTRTSNVVTITSNGLTVANITTSNTIVANTYAFSNTSNTGVVTQQTSKSTSVTANGTFGQIVMNNATLNAGSGVTFTVYNNYIQHVGDMPMVVIQNPVTSGLYQATIVAVRVGSFDIFVYNSGVGAPNNKSDAIVLNWALMRVGS